MKARVLGLGEWVFRRLNMSRGKANARSFSFVIVVETKG